MSECPGVTRMVIPRTEPTTYHCSGCPSLQGDRLTPEEREIVEHDRGRGTIYAPELLIAIIDRLAPKPGGAP